MRALNTLSGAGTTQLVLNDIEFINPGERVLIAGADSVATATLSVQFAGSNVFSGPLAIEAGTDMSPSWLNYLLTQFMARVRGQMIATLGGTVAGARVNFLVLANGEPQPW